METNSSLYPNCTDVVAAIKRGFITRPALALSLHSDSIRETYLQLSDILDELVKCNRIIKVNINGYMCFFPS